MSIVRALGVPGFLPPYLLEHLQRSGDARLQVCVRDTLLDDRHFRARGGTTRLPSPSAQRGQPARYIHSAEQQRTLPGRLVRREGQEETSDPAVDEAYRWLGATYRFFWEVFGRHSIDDRGMALLGTVHYGRHYENAFWDGSQMVFGDGDGEVFNRFTRSLEVVAHELTHGVIERDASLTYQGQSGALNESFADVFGSLVKQYVRGQTVEEADWLIGAELFTDRVNGRAMRSMSNPGSAYDDPLLGRDPQPGHMEDFVETQEDNGGVHINSGIPNRAFYLVATALGGYAWKEAGQLWYDALRDARLAQNDDFPSFAELTITIAGERPGSGNQLEQAVVDAWRTVGVVP